ncbi:MAG: hypothetical protein JW936_06885 [Sedimentisphaerales bacterium]|nr:hypothetical protein [Sedimentisphaerales bacterium]
MSTKTIALILILLAVGCGGCNWFEFPAYVLFGQSHVDVPAEYEGLDETTTAIVVVTDSATDFDFPYARLDIGLVVSDAIRQHIENIQFVNQDQIDVFQREDLDWFNLTMSEIGQRFEADRVLYLDIVRFTMIEDNSIGLLRGRIISDIRVYDIHCSRPDNPVYQTEINITFPEDGPLALSDQAEQQVFQHTLAQFADQLAKKFYDHRVTVEEYSQR